MDVEVEPKLKFDNDLKLKDIDDDNTKMNEDDNEPINKKVKLLKDEETVDEDGETTICAEQDIPETGFMYPLEMDASDMLEEVEFNGTFPSVTERYFTPYYQIDVQKPGDDICIRIHSNRICMITLAPSHMIFQENKTIMSCNFKVSDKLDRLKNKVSGKSKHGAQPLQCNSNLCFLTCNDGSTYTVKCCMIGKLVEVNKRLVEDPELLKREPHFGGYIAIVLPNLKHLEKTRNKLLSQELYDKAINNRTENKDEGEIKVIDEEMKKENDVNKTQIIGIESILTGIDKEMEKETIVNIEINKKEDKKDYTDCTEIMQS